MLLTKSFPIGQLSVDNGGEIDNDLGIGGGFGDSSNNNDFNNGQGGSGNNRPSSNGNNRPSSGGGSIGGGGNSNIGGGLFDPNNGNNANGANVVTGQGTISNGGGGNGISSGGVGSQNNQENGGASGISGQAGPSGTVNGDGGSTNGITRHLVFRRALPFQCYGEMGNIRYNSFFVLPFGKLLYLLTNSFCSTNAKLETLAVFSKAK